MVYIFFGYWTASLLKKVLKDMNELADEDIYRVRSKKQEVPVDLEAWHEDAFWFTNLEASVLYFFHVM